MAVGYRGRIVAGIGEDHSWASFASANRAVRQRRTAQCSFCPYFTKLNRSVTIDSQLSLDAWARLRDSLTMIAQPYRLYIERTDAENNMARFYAMSIEPTLFGEACLMRRWGRIGTRGQLKVHHFEQEKDAVELFLDLVRQKRHRGYRTINSAQHTYRDSLQRR
jgi:predicted DNA-binding WGR domain protein